MIRGLIQAYFKPELSCFSWFQPRSTVHSLPMLDKMGTGSSYRYHSAYWQAKIHLHCKQYHWLTHKRVHRSGDSNTFTFDVNIISDLKCFSRKLKIPFKKSLFYNFNILVLNVRKYSSLILSLKSFLKKKEGLYQKILALTFFFNW